jgi:hypothetical protein
MTHSVTRRSNGLPKRPTHIPQPVSDLARETRTETRNLLAALPADDQAALRGAFDGFQDAAGVVASHDTSGDAESLDFKAREVAEIPSDRAEILDDMAKATIAAILDTHTLLGDAPQQGPVLDFVTRAQTLHDALTLRRAAGGSNALI